MRTRIEMIQTNSERFMKNSLFKQVIVVMILIVAQTTVAQISQGSQQQNKKEKSANTSVKDANANGIDDAKENQSKGKATSVRTRDQFIDTNGDGICDNREQGLGFRRGKMETGKQTGKRQQGKQK